MAVFSVSLHAIFPWFVSMSKFYSNFKDTRHIGSGPTLRASFNLLTPAKVLFSNMSHSEFWGLEFHHELFFGGRHNSSHVNFPSILYLIVKQRYGSARAEVSGPLLVLLLPSDIFFAIKKKCLS